MSRVIDLPSLKAGKKDRVALFDSMGEYAAHFDNMTAVRHSGGGDWLGGQTPEQASNMCRTGDLSRVAHSDEFMSKLENMVGFESRSFRTVDAISGGTPNVGAYLAGSPVNMRRRQRVMTERAPLAVVVDLTSSGGIDARHLEKRGAALLALVRILSALRPVTLWAVVGGKPYSANEHGAVFSAVSMETAPLDLGRAAHFLASQAVSRGMGYPMASAIARGNGNGADDSLAWAYDDVDFYRANGARFWQNVLGLEDVLFIAPAFATDPSIAKPEQFVRDMVAKYGKAADE